MTEYWRRLVRFGFHLLYNEMAFTYDTVSKTVSLGEWRNWQRSALQYLPPPSGSDPILEVAHGTGDLQIDLFEAGYPSIGIDLSPNMGQIARKKLEQHAVSPRLIRSQAQHMPFSSSVFPAVIATFPSEFILARATLQEIYRVLSDEGKLIIVTHGDLKIGGPVKTGIDWLYKITGQTSTDARPIENQFASFGFEVEATQKEYAKSIAHLVILQKIPMESL